MQRGLVFGLAAVLALLVPFGGITARAASGATVTYPTGWNLVGGPDGAIFPVPLYAWDADLGQYHTLAAGTPIQAGQGYWAYFHQPATVTLRGDSSLSSISLNAGAWQQIADPSAQNGVIVEGAGAVEIYDPASGSYSRHFQLAPGQGAWVYAAGGGTIRFNLTVSQALPGTLELPALTRQSDLIALVSTGRGQASAGSSFTSLHVEQWLKNPGNLTQDRLPLAQLQPDDPRTLPPDQQLRQGSEYVLFLQALPDQSGIYHLTDPTESIFAVSGGTISQAGLDQYLGQPLSRFEGLVEASLNGA